MRLVTTKEQPPHATSTCSCRRRPLLGGAVDCQRVRGQYRRLGHGGGLPALAILLAVVFFLERRDSTVNQAYYWAAIILVRTAATNLADLGAGDFHLGRPGLMAALAVVLALVLFFSPPSKSAETATRWPFGLPHTDSRYWTAMLTAGTLGTGVGESLVLLADRRRRTRCGHGLRRFPVAQRDEFGAEHPCHGSRVRRDASAMAGAAGVSATLERGGLSNGVIAGSPATTCPRGSAVVADEGADLRQDFRPPAATVEDAEMADTLLQMMHVLVRRQLRAQVVRGDGLARP